MRIVIFSDSMARARPDLDEQNRTYYSDTYGVLLRQKIVPHHEVDIVHIESLDTSEGEYLVNPYVSFKNPDIVIFQIGINDCAPRIFKKNSFLAKLIYENKLFEKITLNLIPRLINKYRYEITKMFKSSYVDIDLYEKNYNRMIEKIKLLNPNCKFYVISILNSSEKLSKKSFGIQNNIDKYNKRLKFLFKENYIDINEIKFKNIFINDGVHVTKEMHQLIFNKVYKHIKGLL
jgi:lysophospholipase L1-like esterase